MRDTPEQPITIRRAAMDLLARREHSQRELAQKLGKRFDDMTLIDEQLQRLVNENLQSDERYAQSLLRQRSNRGYGPRRLRQEMREKGLSDTDIALAFESVETDWYQLASLVLYKKFGETPPADIKEKARRVRFMQYRGFAREHYQYLLDDGER